MKKADRVIVYNKYGGKCYLCGCELNDKWQVDHMISKNYAIYYKKENEVGNIENLMPACKECNHYKRALCIDGIGSIIIGFREYMQSFHIRFGKYPKNPRDERSIKRKAYMQTIADKYGITKDTPFNGVFFFETYKPAA